MANETLQYLATELAHARARRETLNAELDKLRAEFEARPDVASLMARVTEVSERAAEVESQIRIQAETDYDGENKKLADGIGIQERKAWEYDEADALAWAERWSPALIVRKLDARPYEKLLAARLENKAVAEAFAGMPGELTLKVTATISKDLSSYLKPEAEATAESES